MDRNPIWLVTLKEDTQAPRRSESLPGDNRGRDWSDESTSPGARDGQQHRKLGEAWNRLSLGALQKEANLADTLSSDS